MGDTFTGRQEAASLVQVRYGSELRGHRRKGELNSRNIYKDLFLALREKGEEKTKGTDS